MATCRDANVITRPEKLSSLMNARFSLTWKSLESLLLCGFKTKKIFLAAMNLVSIAFGPQIIGSQHLVPMDICCQSVNTTKLSCSLINARF